MLIFLRIRLLHVQFVFLSLKLFQEFTIVLLLLIVILF